MSSANWWRGLRSSSELETRGETIWPGLSSANNHNNNNHNNNINKRARRKPRGISYNRDDILGRIRIHQVNGIDRSSLLDDEGYPKLGQRISKRKFNSANQNSSRDDDGFCDQEATQQHARFDKLGIDNNNRQAPNPPKDEDDVLARRHLRKFNKKSKRSDVICIDLKEMIERRRSLSESQTSSSVKPRSLKLNLNLTIRNPLDSSMVIQCRKGKQREIPRAKKISKLKRVIFREREFKKLQANILKRELFDMEKIQAITKDVNGIDFDKLNISGESKSDIQIARDLSTLNLFDNKYRRSSVSGDHFRDLSGDPGSLDIGKNDVVEKLENLFIENDKYSDSNANVFSNRDEDDGDREFVENSNIILNKTQCLKICDETGEIVEEFDKPEIKPSELLVTNVKQENEIRPSSQNVLRHSRNFREYCTNELTPELNKSSEIFLGEIYRLQRRMYERDEVKGRSRRRFYAGFKEVLKHVQSGKIRFVFIAPDLEGIHGYPGGLDEIVGKLIAACKIREVVLCFSLNKRKLGYHTHKKGSVSCVGITNYAGLEEMFKDVLTELMKSRDSFRRLNPPHTGSDGTLNLSNQEDWEETLLSTKINILFKNLTIAQQSWS